jgi:2-succinyl-6-hydroxy-2,4-cyclohexadiene-1-carboxylate synthase
MPVLLIVGEYDHKYREIAQRMVQALPDGRLEVIAGAGHAVHLERPAAVAALIAGR